jgi:hypothetical protein
MIIQFNSNEIKSDDNVFDQYRDEITKGLKRFGDRVARVAVHIADENGRKAGEDDKRCTMEARLDGLEPIAVTAYAGNPGQAVHDALAKLKKALGSAVEKMRPY